MEGRIWEILKKMNRAGRAFHLAACNRALASEYNLDILHGRGRTGRNASEPAVTSGAAASGRA
ncbi:MAG: hypothetical protein HYV63_29265 [Candidatus Schekmanbacteria bacterium]|nr:hypothetical protein [Candidatus Schekmanbacteria bacterium]